ncbi:hypothetical protein TH9_22670 [Thalassospira xiamenensis]|jgi:predicted restriction endonuclease|uniref:HNH endonuclease n=1 Tax=Thalassospira xiamenensis TaxID=220697 RepID=UPI000DEDE8F3|nr:HNH endonuclease [Thalassospira xiamenensis]RCK26413.1 hypothetical protein TH9_22670 [Thalassospira xiamenensis]
MYWWQSVEAALENLGGTASLREIYDEVQRIREVENASITMSLEANVRKELEYNSSDSANWRKSRDIFFSVNGIGQGVWGLRSAVPENTFACDIEEPENLKPSKRQEITVTRIIRDTAMTRKIKALHKSKCQICGETIPTSDDRGYVEAHHIRPLGKPHQGPDIPSNIIVVCPNHHAMLDLGMIGLNLDLITKAIGHDISDASIAYHNTVVAKTPVYKDDH